MKAKSLVDSDVCSPLIDDLVNCTCSDTQERLARVGLEWILKILSKNADYGCSIWKTPKLAPECSVAEGIFVRMSDKVERIEALRRRGGRPLIEDEALDDTIADLGAYCLLYLARPQEDTGQTDQCCGD